MKRETQRQKKSASNQTFYDGIRLSNARQKYENKRQERDADVKEEIKHLREAMEQLSGSAQDLARQRDDARAALAKAKGTLRRMAPVSHLLLWPSLSCLLDREEKGVTGVYS